MKRRGFLAALASAFALDPERALWVPGAKLISIPAPVNVLLPWQRHIYTVLQNHLHVRMAENGLLGYYAKLGRPLKVGDIIGLRRPLRFMGVRS